MKSWIISVAESISRTVRLREREKKKHQKKPILFTILYLKIIIALPAKKLLTNQRTEGLMHFLTIQI